MAVKQARHRQARPHVQEVAREPQDTFTDGGPWIERSRRRSKVGIDFGSTLMTGSVQNLGPKAFPSGGFIKQLYCDVNATGGVAGGSNAVAQADAPYNAVDFIFQDPSGQPLFPGVKGYDLYLINLFGGYHFEFVPALTDPFAVTIGNPGNFRYALWIPFELVWHGGTQMDAFPFGVINNENSSAANQMTASIQGSGVVYSTAPGTLPSLSIQTFLDLYAKPLNGPEAPPMLGTTPYWTRQQITGLSAGFNSGILLPGRKGYPIHTLLLQFRDSAGARLDITGMNDFSLIYNDYPIYDKVPVTKLLRDAYRDWGFFSGAIDSANGIPKGVLPISYRMAFSEKPSRADTVEQWLQTTPATQIQISGTLPTNTSQVFALVGDVIAEGVGLPEER